MAQQDELLLVQEILMLGMAGSSAEVECASDPLNPRLSAEHYDALALAIVSLARIRPDPEDTVRTLARLLPALEQGAIIRSLRLQFRTPTWKEDPVLQALPEEEQDAYVAALQQEAASHRNELLARIRRMTEGPP